MSICRAARRYFPDEEADVERVGAVGWELTDEAHGYCASCGRWGHRKVECPDAMNSESALY